MSPDPRCLIRVVIVQFFRRVEGCAMAKFYTDAPSADLPTGPREPKSAVLSVEEEAITVAFRRHIACIRFSY
jgi:hypothetical protein